MEVRLGAGVEVQVPDEHPLAATTCGGLGKAGSMLHLVEFPSPHQALEAGTMHPPWLRGLRWCLLSMQLTQQIPSGLPLPTRPPIMHQTTTTICLLQHPSLSLQTNKPQQRRTLGQEWEHSRPT